MDPDVLLSKLDSLQRCIARIRKKTPASLSELEDDLDACDIIALNLERAVQQCVDIAFHMIASHPEVPVPDTMAGAFRCLVSLELLGEEDGEGLVKSVGFRNISVHSYTEIDWAIVYAIITEHLCLFERFGSQILSQIREKGTGRE